MTTPNPAYVADHTNDVLLAALREHMVQEPPEPMSGTGPIEFYERQERVRLKWEQQRDAFHLILGARLLRAYLEANGVTQP